MSSEVVNLNVGGIKYSTTRETLCKYPESMLGTVFSENKPYEVDKDGCYFIDRDGEIFRYVLQYLRTDEWSLPKEFKDFDLLANETDFFQIRPLIQKLSISKQEMKAMDMIVICYRFGESYIPQDQRRSQRQIVPEEELPCYRFEESYIPQDQRRSQRQIVPEEELPRIKRLFCKRVNDPTFEIVHSLECSPEIEEELIDSSWILKRKQDVATCNEFVALLLTIDLSKPTFASILADRKDDYFSISYYVRK